MRILFSNYIKSLPRDVYGVREICTSERVVGRLGKLWLEEQKKKKRPKINKKYVASSGGGHLQMTAIAAQSVVMKLV